MSNRVADMGMDVAIKGRLNSKYDESTEREVIGWLSKVVSGLEPIQPGKANVQARLKNGHVLLCLMQEILTHTPSLPPRAAQIRLPLVKDVNPGAKKELPFKQMEKIQTFLNCANAYGVPDQSLFQTVDLFEAQNMVQVLNTLLQLGTECQRNGFTGPVCGPKPTSENRRQFDEATLRSGEGMIGLQSGTNKFASQKGMRLGASRFIADTPVPEMCDGGKTSLNLQMGTNQYASQKGMRMGASRFIADTPVPDMCDGGKTSLNLQMGTNQYASQKGMMLGRQRHINDVKTGGDGEMSAEAKSTIGLQMGSNKGATQAGMMIGGQRHINDVKTGGAEMTKAGESTIGLQMGANKNQGANQSGMRFGAQRGINDRR